MNNLDELPSAYYNRQRPKNYDRNFYTASVHIITIILTWMSILQNDWFQMEFGICKSQLSIKQVLPYINSSGSVTQVIQTDSFINEICPTIDFTDLTPQIVNLMRIALHLCIWVICFSGVAFVLDFFGSMNKTIKIIRRNAIPGIITVLLISILIGVCYFISVLLSEMLEDKFPEFFFTVSYGSGFYTVTAAGVVAAMATSITLLLAPLPTDDIIERL